MHRFFVPPEALAGEVVPLEGEVLHHLGTVLRSRPGEEVLLLDGEGLLCRCRIDLLGRRSGRAQVLERWREEENSLPVRLLQALPKGDKFDLVLQKGTELGVTSFVPVLAGRSVAGLTKDRGDSRLHRWRRIAGEAARQCRRPLLPTVTAPVPLAEALAGCEDSLRLMLWEEENRPLAEVLSGIAPTSVAILVGPEGGFAPAEARLAKASGFLPVRIGPRILRTETAGFAVAAILQYLFGDLGTAASGNVPGPPTEGECR